MEQGSVPGKSTSQGKLLPQEPTSVDLVLSSAEERLHQQARAFLRASKAESTLRAYRSDWGHFAA